MSAKSSYYERGEFNPLIIVVIILSLSTIGLGGLSIWSFSNYREQKTNVDEKIGAAVVEAKREQSEADEAKFAEEEKKPNKQFVGPEDLGRVEFQYPKTWSGYIDKLGTGNSTYEAYLQPGVVPPLSEKTPYALRVTIEDRSYDEALAKYESKVKAGELKSSSITINDETGAKLEGKFSDEIDGIMVILKVRDKSLKVYTESRTFKNDFEKIILPSLKFNK